MARPHEARIQGWEGRCRERRLAAEHGAGSEWTSTTTTVAAGCAVFCAATVTEQLGFSTRIQNSSTGEGIMS